MDTIQLIFWFFILFFIAIGIYVTKFVKTSSDFYVMNKRGNTFFITGTLLASLVSASTFLGIAGIVYENGPPIFLIVFTSWLGTCFAAIYTGRRLRAYNCETMPDYLEYRFGSGVRIVGTIIMLVGLIGYGLIQLMGAGVVLAAITGLPYELMITLFVAVLLIFGVLGGMWAVIVTDTLMCITFIVATFIIAPIGFFKAGGVENITQTLLQENPLYWSAGGAVLEMPIGWTIGQMVLWILFMTAAPWLATRTFAARNDFVVLKSAIWTLLFATSMVTVYYLGVFAVRTLNPGIDPPDTVLVWMSQNLVHPVIGGLGIAGIMAAILSTASTIFIYAGFALSKDLYERLISREMSDKEKVLKARAGQLIVGIIMLIIGLTRPVSIYWIGAWAGALFAVSWLPVLVAGFHWKKASKQGVISSMIVGAVSYILLYQMINGWKLFSFPFGIDPVIPSVILSFIVLFAVSKIKSADASTISKFEQLRRIPLNSSTLENFAEDREGFVKSYKSTRNLAIGSSIAAILFFGYLIIEIALKV